MNQLTLVYLAREADGIDSALSFAHGYTSVDPGVPHRLLVVFKGFRSSHQLERWESALAPLPHSSLCISDGGRDVRAYRCAAEKSSSPFLCFLNSHSVPVKPNWLGTLVSPLRDNRFVGIVGCTGSWASFYDIAVRRLREARRGTLSWLVRYAKAKANQCLFPEFPNPHIRTNAFAVTRSLFVQEWPRRASTKLSAYRNESGYFGFTRRLLDIGFDALVVNARGETFQPHQWHRSDTFCSGEQASLLVEDNQTRRYANGTPIERATLSLYAWGKQGYK